MDLLRKEAVRFVVVHCSATSPTADIGARAIRLWHTEKGWADIGYHYVIRRSGLIEPGRGLDYQGDHVRGHNHESLGVCLVGGVNANGAPDANFTAAQWASLESLMALLLERYAGSVPRGHRDFTDRKACPCFDVRAWWTARSASE